MLTEEGGVRVLHPKVLEFLRLHSSDHALLAMALSKSGLPTRVERLRHGQQLCSKGDLADEVWILIEGAVRVEDCAQVVVRRCGEMVGEMAFYREDGRFRGADMVADGEACLFRIDASVVDQLQSDAAIAWHRMIARILTTKLDTATHQRVQLRASRYETDDLLKRFVDCEGYQAVSAAIGSGLPCKVDAERCDVIVWFSDIAGFSAHAATMSADETAALIRRLMDIQAESIREAGGQIDKFMGDGLMAFWRVPDADRRRRFVPKAVEAALAASRQIDELANSLGNRLSLRVGLHLGPAVIGDFGGGDRIAFTLIGHTVNSASRYEQARHCAEGRSLGRVRLSDTVFTELHGTSLVDQFERTPRYIEDKHGVRHPVYSTVEGE